MRRDANSTVISRCLRGDLSPTEAARHLWKLRDTVTGLAMGVGSLSGKRRARAEAMYAELMKIMRRSVGQRRAWARRQGKVIAVVRD